jgi:hypothetical protein
VAGCATLSQTFSKTLAQIVSDVSLIANGIGSILPQLSALAGLSDSARTTIQAAIAGIKLVADQIKGIASTADGQPLIQQLEGYLNAIISALAMLPLPPQISVILQAAMVLLPILEALVGLLMKPAANRFGSAMSPDAARLVLASWAPKK